MIQVLQNSRSELSLKALGVDHNWEFAASPVPIWRRRLTVESMLRRGIRMPEFLCVKDVDCRPQ